VSARAVWDDLFAVLGEDLRAVTRYDGMDYDTVMREGIREQYTVDEDRAIVDDTIVKQLGLGNTEGAFKTGRLEAVVRVFEDAWVVSIPDRIGAKSGFIVSVERGGAATMDDVDECVGRVRERTDRY